MDERNPTLSCLKAIQAEDQRVLIQSWGLQLYVGEASQHTEDCCSVWDVEDSWTTLLQLLTSQVFSLDQDLNYDHRHVLKEELSDGSLISEALGSFLVELKNIFKNKHESIFDKVVAVVANSNEADHLSDSHQSAEKLYTHDVERADESKEDNLNYSCDQGILFQDLWLIRSIVQEQLDDGRISHKVGGQHTYKHDSGGYFVRCFIDWRVLIVDLVEGKQSMWVRFDTCTVKLVLVQVRVNAASFIEVQLDWRIFVMENVLVLILTHKVDPEGVAADVFDPAVAVHVPK